MQKLTGVLCASAFTTLCACSTTPKAPALNLLLTDDYSRVTQYLQQYIPERMDEHDITGLSVALVDDQRVVWSEGFGFADADAEVPATAATQYRAGSVSKLFTALAVMQLKEQQRLTLDAPLVDSLPSFSIRSRFGSTDDITLRNVLSHHSGIPDSLMDGMFTTEPAPYTYVTEQMGQYFTAAPPNTVFGYSNIAYTLAGHAVEHTSNTPFTEYMHTQILEPLGMMNSNFRYDTTGDAMSKSYIGGKEVEELPLRDLPAGGLISTVGDLSQLLKWVIANKPHVESNEVTSKIDGVKNTDKTQLSNVEASLITPNTLQEMLAIQSYETPYTPDPFNGLGWFHFSGMLDNKYAVIGHGGQTMAHNALVAVAPDAKLGVVLMANGPSGGLHEIADEILSNAYPVATRQSLDDVPKRQAEPTPLPGEPTDFNGQYTSVFGHINITGDSDGHELQVAGDSLDLSPNDTGSHTIRAKILGFIKIKIPGLSELSLFAREVDGKKVLYGRNRAGRNNLIATEMETEVRNPVWHDRMGVYQLINPVDTDIKSFQFGKVELVYEDGAYHVVIQDNDGRHKQPIRLINDNEAVIQGYGRGRGETIFAGADGSMLHTGWVFRKVPDENAQGDL